MACLSWLTLLLNETNLKEALKEMPMQQPTPGGEKPGSNIPDLQNLAPANSQFTNEEWKLLIEVPVKVGRAMMAVSPSGAVGMSSEIMALRKSLQELIPKSTSPLIKEMGKNLQEQATMSAMWEDVGHAFRDRWDAANVRQTTIAACQQAVNLLKKAPAQDSQAYKELVHTTAQKVAEAAREGGFAGIGGQAISEPERALLNDIANTLGLQRA